MDSALEQKSHAVISITDSNYASRCATMIETAGIEDFTTLVTLDKGALELQRFFPRLQALGWDKFLEDNPAINAKIEGRSKSEKIFSLGPSFLLTQVKHVLADGWLVYVDSDLYFFETLEEYLVGLPACNVVIAPHRHYPWNRKRLAKYGEFNVGLVAFRNNEDGLKALRFWAENCLSWCYDNPLDGKYADQKYLEDFSRISEGVFVDNSSGSNLAPWNSSLRRLTVTKSGQIFVSGDKLVYFHAQGLKLKNHRWVLSHLNYFSLAGRRLKKLVYRPYLKRIEGWMQKSEFKSFETSRASNIRKDHLMYYLSWMLGQTVATDRDDPESKYDSLK